MRIDVPYTPQKQPFSCVYACTAMRLQHLGLNVTEESLRELHPVDHTVTGTSYGDLAQLLNEVSRKEQVKLKATFYIDPTDDAHAAVYFGILRGNKIVVEDDPKKLIERRPKIQDITLDLWKKAVLMFSQAKDTGHSYGQISPLMNDRIEGYVADIEGSPKRAMLSYMDDIMQLEKVKSLGHDVRLYIPRASRTGLATQSTPTKGETIEGMIESNIPVLAMTVGHMQLIVGYEEKPIIHDPDPSAGANLTEGTALHERPVPSSVILIQKVA